jgi:UDP-N-acetylglucosamine 3-dehydrogenase
MDPVRVGLIGVGAFGESHLIAYRSLPYVRIAAICDVNATRVQEIAKRYGVARWYTDYREMLREVDLDAVSVTTPEDAHLAPVLAALQAGKHVLVEKPIATRLDEAEQMLAAARAAGCYLMPGHVLRFETRYALVKDQLTAGELGKLISISARRNRPKSLAKTYLRTHGVLGASIHDLDIILWYAGDRVKRVHSLQRNFGGHPHPDATWAWLEFEGGAVATVENMWMNPDQGGVGLNDAMQVTGTRGIAHIDMVNTGLSLWREGGYMQPDVSYEPRVRGEMFGALKEEIAYFARCVLEGRPPDVVTAEESVEALRVALAIIESPQAA